MFTIRLEGNYIESGIDLQRRILAASPKPDFLDKLSMLIVNRIEQNLKDQITWFGFSAAPLRPATIAKKGHDRIFLHYGVLYRSIKYRIVPGGREIYVAQPRTLPAYYLQFGTPNMIERPFFGIRDFQFYNFVDQLIQDGG